MIDLNAIREILEESEHYADLTIQNALADHLSDFLPILEAADDPRYSDEYVGKLLRGNMK